MKQLLKQILYTLLLAITETGIVTLLFFFEHSIEVQKMDIHAVAQAVKDGWEVSAVRFIFYYLFYLIAFLFLTNVTRWKLRLLQVAVVNVSLYIVLSLFYSAFIPGVSDFLLRDFFYFTIIATAFSPFVLGMPLQRRLLAPLVLLLLICLSSQPGMRQRAEHLTPITLCLDVA